MNKRGMSLVVTTLIIILLAIVAVGIVWVVVKNIVNKGREEITLTGLTLDLEITKVVLDDKGTPDDTDDDELFITVKRNPGEGNLVGINFVISDGDNSVVVQEDTTLAELGVQTFSYFTNTLAVGKITSISIAPIFETSSGKEVTGEVRDSTTSDSGDFGSGDTSYTGDPGGGEEPCIPNCAGKECGDDGCFGTCPPGCTGTDICGGDNMCHPYDCLVDPEACTTQGAECGVVYDDCGYGYDCGNCTSYGENYACSVNVCIEGCTDTCETLGKECGIWMICDVDVDCEVWTGGCPSGYKCVPGNDTCQIITYIMAGTVDTVWPPTKNTYFDTDDPPIDDPSLSYALNYIKFPGSDESECLMIQKSVVPESPELPPYYNKTIIYLFAIQTDVAPNDNYEIWETYEGCYGP